VASAGVRRFCPMSGLRDKADVSLLLALLPGIKARMRRRAAPDRPLGRALLQRHQQNFGGRT
jgi:hypothetical protein